MKTRMLLIGCGKMGEALLAGWLSLAENGNDGPSGLRFVPGDITVVEPNEERREFLAEHYGVATLASIGGIDSADFVVLAVKPQIMGSVVAELHAAALAGTTRHDPLYISIAAGVTTSFLETALGTVDRPASVVRVMPNLPLTVRQGASALCCGTVATDADGDLVRGLFGALGSARVVDESAMDAVCALSGSGPAYVAAFLEAESRAAEKLGLSHEVALDLALQTMEGTVALLKQTGQSPAELRRAVSSPNGTTVAGLDALYGAGFEVAIDQCLKAADRRSRELSQCSSV